MNLNAVFDKYIWTKYPVPNTVLGPRDLTFLREENDYTILFLQPWGL